MPETEHVIDVCQASDPLVHDLISINELAKSRWSCSPPFARRLLLQRRVRLAGIWGRFHQCLLVRKSDVEQVERDLTVFLKHRKRNQMKS
jgi:hypothetical protein